MHFLNHKVKILLHLMTEQYNWWEYKENQPDLSEAKKIVQKTLKPGQVPGGTPDENIGKHFTYLYYFKQNMK
jgi:hypothetical protein